MLYFGYPIQEKSHSICSSMSDVLHLASGLSVHTYCCKWWTVELFPYLGYHGQCCPEPESAHFHSYGNRSEVTLLENLATLILSSIQAFFFFFGWLVRYFLSSVISGCCCWPGVGCYFLGDCLPLSSCVTLASRPSSQAWEDNMLLVNLKALLQPGAHRRSTKRSSTPSNAAHVFCGSLTFSFLSLQVGKLYQKLTEWSLFISFNSVLLLQVSGFYTSIPRNFF